MRHFVFEHKQCRLKARQLKWSQYEPEKDLEMLKDYDFCGHKINLQKRNFKSNGSLLFFPSAEAGSGTDEKAFISNSCTIISSNTFKDCSNLTLIVITAKL